MRLDVLQRLVDIRSAAILILEYTNDITESEYLVDTRTRDAVDRRLAIIGEALGKLVRLDASFALLFPETPQIVGLRNVIIHEYEQVDDYLIWRLVQHEVPRLLRRVQEEIHRREGADI